MDQEAEMRAKRIDASELDDAVRRFYEQHPAGLRHCNIDDINRFKRESVRYSLWESFGARLIAMDPERVRPRGTSGAGGIGR